LVILFYIFYGERERMELGVGGMLKWIYKSNPESLLVKVGIGDSKPVLRQEALAL
jgi:hypothetical protein